jgi:hypothetical protein
MVNLGNSGVVPVMASKTTSVKTLKGLKLEIPTREKDPHGGQMFRDFKKTGKGRFLLLFLFIATMGIIWSNEWSV